MNKLADFVISALIVLFVFISALELRDVILSYSYGSTVTYQP